MTNRNDLPPPSAGNFPQRVRETLMTYLGKQGNPLDRGLTLRDLIENGIIKLAKGWRPGGDIPLLEPGDAVAQGDEPDLTPPPTPTGFAVSAAISHVFIEHDQPAYLMGHGHLRTRLYGVTHTAGQPLPTFNNAVELGQFSGTIWALASNPATTWRLWIKWETNDGVLSAAPAGGTNGLEAVTGQDVATLLAALTGEITESQLYQSLGERINLVDGNGAGSVNARLLAEANARGAAILAEQTARQGADTSLASQITTLTAAVNTADANLAAAIQTEATARASADTAEAQARQTLAATVNSNTAAIQTEQTVRVSETGQLFARYTVKTDVNGYVSGFGLASTANGATPTSAFAIRSDSFYIASPEGPGVAPAMPFIVRTTPVTINGVSVPVGVYMSDAFIQNGTITNAKIANLAVDDAKVANLNASKINAGFISADRIQAGSLDAKLLNVDAAAITYGYINVARIADAAITSAKIASLDANKINATSLSAISANLGTVTAGSISGVSMNINGKFIVDANGNATLKSGDTGERMVVTNTGISVYDANGVLRVRIGSL
ncbi:MAG: DUF1983 domain-containing protein [Limnohabitans sp.]|uniref:phage tail tip fiber protein n=1 Tax=Limnohabitans sp. TaxID=1907725 RepID=UPI003BAFD12E